MKCDKGWVCETHPDQPWPHGDCGIGMPCPEPKCPYSMAVPVHHAERTVGCTWCKVVYSMLDDVWAQRRVPGTREG